MAENPDQGLGVEFFVKPVELKAKSIEAGRPIYEDREFIRIRFPGDNKRELTAPANEVHYNGNTRESMTYAERFAANYAAFKESRADFVSGTPLSSLPGLGDARREELKALNIVTIEQLAQLPDTARKRLGMGGLELVNMAKDFMEKASGVAEIEALRAELAALKAERQGGPVMADPFEGFDDDDLKNMIRDAGGEVPKGNAKRETLIARLQEISKQKEDAA